MAKVRGNRPPSTLKLSKEIRAYAEQLELRRLLSTDIFIGTANGDGTIGEYTTSGAAVNPALISQLGAVQGIAVTGSNLYVASGGNTAIGQYTTSGGIVNTAFGAGLTAPYGVAVSGSNLFVTNDSSAGYVAEYSASGATVNASLIAGLNDPQNIAVSGSDLFVASFAGGTIGEYTTSGATVNASLISGLQLNNSNPIAVSGSDLFVVSNGAVAEYTTSGATVNASLITGLSNPAGIAVSGSDLFVLCDDNGNGLVEEFTTAGATVNASLITGLDAPTGIAVAASTGNPQLTFAQQPASGTTTGKLAAITVDVDDSNGNLLTSDNSRVMLAIASGTAGATLGGTTSVSATNGVATFSNLSITTAGTYTLTATDGTDTAATSTPFQVSPPDALVGTPGDLFVSGNQAEVIYEVNPTTGVIVGEVSANGDSVLGMRFDSSGNLYAVDSSDGTLEEYNGTTGSHIGTVASGILDGAGLAIADGDFYVADSLARQIDVFDGSGSEVNAIATQDFSNLPLGLAVSSSGEILVGTQNGSQIDSFDLEGSDPTVFASSSKLSGSAFGLAYGPNGNLYVSNSTANSIIELNGTTGAYITSITGNGLNGPSGLAFGPNGDLYVANDGNDTISVFNATTSAPITTFSGFGGVYDLAFNSHPSPTVDKLAIVSEPTNTTTSETLPPITVDIEDSNGNVVTSDNSNVTIAIFNGAAFATQGGTTTVAAVNGVATFSDLTISNPGDNYTLIATDGSDTTATSTSFDILSPTDAQIFVTNSGDGSVGGYTSSGTTVAAALISGLGTPSGIALSGSDLFITDQDGGTIGEYTTSGAVINASLVSDLDSPTSIVVVGSDLFVTNIQSNTIGEYTTSGATVNDTLVSGLNGPQGITVSGTDLFVTNIDNGTIGEYTMSGATVNASLITGLNAPVGIAISGSDLFVTSSTSIGEYTLDGNAVNAALVTGLAARLELQCPDQICSWRSFAANSIGEYTTSGATVNASLITGLNSPYGIAMFSNNTVGGGSPPQLAFGQQPTSTATTGTLGPITVDVEDPSGNLLTNDNSEITLAIASGPAGAVLGGGITVAAVNGVATFSDLLLTTAGSYTLIATDGSDTAATSSGFTIYLPPETIGGLDLGFGVNGLASHDVGFSTTNGIAQDGTQSVIIGAIGTSPTQSFGITRFNSDGSLDTTFGTGGVASTSFGGTDDVPSAVDVLANGNILVAGTATTYTNGVASGSEFAIAEFNPDGSLDTSFGSGTGQILVSFSNTPGTLSNDVLKSMAIGRGGVICLGGSSDAGGMNASSFAITALNADGTIDSKFGTGGKELQSIGDGDDVINALALQTSGDIIAAGSAVVGGITEIALARFLPSGLLDKHFGIKGLVTTNVRGVYDSASSVLVQAKGQIVVGGLSATGSGASLSSDFVVVRYTSAGKIDKSFGGGPVITSFGQPSAITQVVLQANGDIIASGKTTTSLTGFALDTLDVAVARYTPSGKLDTAFSGNGKTIIDLGTGVIATSDITVEPLDTVGLGSDFDAFHSSQQGATVLTSSEMLGAGISGSNTIEADIITRGVDLVTSLLTQPPLKVVGGSKSAVSVKIVEYGNDTAIGTITIELEIATDSQGNGATIVKTLAERISLSQGKSRTYKIAFTYPSSLTAGDYYLVAAVDNGSSAAMQDLNPQNELAASKSAVNIAPPLISLDASNLSSGSTITIGKSAVAIFTVTNDGNVTGKGKTTANLYLSTDDTAADGTLVDAAKLSVSLAAGKSKVYRISFKLPKTFTGGTYYLIAVVDPVNSLGVTDQSDSTVVDPTQLTVR